MRILGHMARANPQWRSFSEEREVLAIFHGPHAYVSPRYYVNGLNVPTWSYAVVHAYGTPRLIEEPAEALRVLQETTARFEAARSGPGASTTWGTSRRSCCRGWWPSSCG